MSLHPILLLQPIIKMMTLSETCILILSIFLTLFLSVECCKMILSRKLPTSLEKMVDKYLLKTVSWFGSVYRPLEITISLKRNTIGGKLKSWQENTIFKSGKYSLTNCLWPNQDRRSQFLRNGPEEPKGCGPASKVPHLQDNSHLDPDDEVWRDARRRPHR